MEVNYGNVVLQHWSLNVKFKMPWYFTLVTLTLGKVVTTVYYCGIFIILAPEAIVIKLLRP